MSHTDWLATLREQADIGKQMAHDVPLMLAQPNVTLAQVRRVFGALDHQAHFVEELANVLEEKGYDFAVVDAARSWRISLLNSQSRPPTRWFR